MCLTLSFNLNQCNDKLTSFSVMKNKIAPILFLFFSLYSFGQTSSFNRGGQFSLGTEIGLVSSKASVLSGNDQLKTIPIHAQTFNLHYKYRFNDKCYSSIGGGLGYINFKYKFPTYEFSNSISGFYYQLDINTAYSILSRPKSHLNAKMGVGFSQYDATFGEVKWIGQSDVGYLNYKNDSVPNFFFQLGAEYSVKTKKQNEWGFFLSYRYEINSNRTGSWYYSSLSNPISSSGNFKQSNSGLRFGVEYTFTRARKKESIAKAIESGQSKKQFKKEKRFNNRYIHPKRKSISIYTGLGLMQTSIKTSNPYYKNAFAASFIPEISYEHGIQSNFFFETSLNYNDMERKTVFRNEGVKVSGSYGGFRLAMLSAGINYKVQLPKSRLQIVNIHAGIGVGIRTSNQFQSNYINSFNTDYVNQTMVSNVSGKVIPVLYLGLSKDIRLNEHWSLNLQYKKQFGLNTIVQTDIYYQLPNSSETMYAKGILNGTGHLFRLGLTYHLPQKDK